MSLEWMYANAVASVWAWVNMEVKKWAEAHADRIEYIQVRLEDICDPLKNGIVVNNVLDRLGLNASKADSQTFVEQVVDVGRCHLQKYATKDPELVQYIEKSIHRGLDIFGYPASPTSFPDDLTTAASETFYVSTSTRPTKFCILTFVNDGYAEVFWNFLRHLYDSAKSEDGDSPMNLIVSTNSVALMQLLQFREVSSLNNLDESTISKLATLLPIISSKIHVLPYLVPPMNATSSQIRNVDIWRFRVEAAEALLNHGWHIAIVDVDAIVTKGVKELLPAWTQERPNPLSSFDIIASRGRFPYDISERWGHTGT
jgi:hypothetical protein